MSTPYFDAHCDTALPVMNTGGSLYQNRFHLDLRRLSDYAPCAQVFALCPAYGPDMTRQTERALDYLLRELDANAGAVRLCLTGTDIAAATAEGKIAAFISVEGAEKLDCDFRLLQAAYDKGVRILHLTWNHDNRICGAAMDSGGGLTRYGREFVTAAQTMGVVIDLSHLSERGFWEVLDMTSCPVLAGHSNAAALCPHPRNLTDEQFSALREAGGVVGLNFSPSFLGLTGNIDAIAAHAEHWLSLGGERTVCLGGDLDGIGMLPNGISGVESLDKLYDAMLRKNWSESLVRNIFWNNAKEFMERALQ